MDRKEEKVKKAQDQLLKALDDNKKKYDRQLYADWVVKVYDKCATMCIRKGFDSSEDSKYATELREVEKNCGRNCIRKYDKIYKLYTALEPKITTQHCEE